jgi:hypothetical protein
MYYLREADELISEPLLNGCGVPDVALLEDAFMDGDLAFWV